MKTPKQIMHELTLYISNYYDVIKENKSILDKYFEEESVINYNDYGNITNDMIKETIKVLLLISRMSTLTDALVSRINDLADDINNQLWN